MNAAFTVNSLSGKQKQPHDLIIFEWEKQEDWYKQKYRAYSKQEKQSIVDYYVNRKDPDYNA